MHVTHIMIFMVRFVVVRFIVVGDLLNMVYRYVMNWDVVYWSSNHSFMDYRCVMVYRYKVVRLFVWLLMVSLLMMGIVTDDTLGRHSVPVGMPWVVLVSGCGVGFICFIDRRNMGGFDGDRVVGFDLLRDVVFYQGL